MHKRGRFYLILFMCFLLWSSKSAFADRIKAFVPDKPWESTIEIDSFTPSVVMQPKTILGGATKNGLIITVIAEQEKSPSTPLQILTKYWHYGKPGEYITEYKSDNMMIVSSKEVQSLLGQAFNGYVVKDDYSFDIHVSADLSKTTKQQVFATIRSFNVVLSSEKQDMDKLAADLDLTKKEQTPEQLLLPFTEKYPNNTWAFARLGEVYFGMKKYDAAEKAYLKALENQKKQPLFNGINLWCCYDGLGMINGMSHRYEPSRQYLEKGYQFADELGSDKLLAESAYNLACWYAETKDHKNCLKFLGEAINLDKTKKNGARTDPSFESIRNQADFEKLISK